jgi:hypothetical protein
MSRPFVRLLYLSYIKYIIISYKLLSYPHRFPDVEEPRGRNVFTKFGVRSMWVQKWMFLILINNLDCLEFNRSRALSAANLSGYGIGLLESTQLTYSCRK